MSLYTVLLLGLCKVYPVLVLVLEGIHGDDRFVDVVEGVMVTGDSRTHLDQALLSIQTINLMQWPVL